MGDSWKKEKCKRRGCHNRRRGAPGTRENGNFTYLCPACWAVARMTGLLTPYFDREGQTDAHCVETCRNEKFNEWMGVSSKEDLPRYWD